jgi:hypothetical protein
MLQDVSEGAQEQTPTIITIYRQDQHNTYTRSALLLNSDHHAAAL